MKKKRLIFLSLLVTLSSSCSQSKPETPKKDQEITDNTFYLPSNQSETAQDKVITHLILQDLYNDIDLSEAARNVSVSTNNGVVTVEGNVPTYKDKNEVLLKVQHVTGVSRVINKVQVVK